MSFKNIGLSNLLLKAIEEKGYNDPSPIQAQAIPAILKNGDLIACAQTGTGKTAGFTLPILHLLSANPKKPIAKTPRVLILAPTRELAAQIKDSINDYGKYLPLTSTVVYGGVKINKQILRLQGNVDILVATPGRLLDLYNQRAVSLGSVEIVVLDEADRMLDMGFINDIKKILSLLPKKRQNLLFSATFSNDIRKFAKGLLCNPVEINVTPPNSTARNIEHRIYPVDKARKAELLIHLISVQNWQQALIFSRTKHGANRLVQRLAKAKIEALAIHGNKSQAQRLNALSSFKQGKIKFLVATDIAARGIDIDQLPQVVNFDLPAVAEDYVHRIGRTGRAGASGKAISLFSVDETKQLLDIERVLKRPIDREIIKGFEPSSSSKSFVAPERAPLPARPHAEAGQKNTAHRQKFRSRNSQSQTRDSSERNTWRGRAQNKAR